MPRIEEMMTPSDDHPCIIEFQKDPMSWVEQYMVHCACHDGSGWYTWRPGDSKMKCRGNKERSR